MITPPAGAVGRGDGFILRIAEKSGAVVLSNDSFQEFHAERPWLFEPGRLIGGKPVPGVGWIFTPRTPVRGARSRSVTGRSRRVTEATGGDLEELEVGAGTEFDEGAVPTRTGRPRAAKANKTNKTAKSAKSTKAAKEPSATRSVSAGKSTKPAKSVKAIKPSKTTRATKTTKGTASAEQQVTVQTTKSGKVAKGIEPVKAAKAAKPSKTSKATKAAKATTAAKAAKPSKTTKTSKSSKATKATKTTKADQADKAPGSAGGSRRRSGGTAQGQPSGEAAGSDKREDRTNAAPEALNDPMTFLTFVADHPVGSTFEGTVTAFTSHGAHVAVDGMLCHVPLRGLGDPPPNKARQVLSKGETRSFVLVSLDAARRRAELALPGVRV
jgi:hypothetical protein